MNLNHCNESLVNIPTWDLHQECKDDSTLGNLECDQLIDKGENIFIVSMVAEEIVGKAWDPS